MRGSHPRPGARNVLLNSPVRLAWLCKHNRRIAIAVAEFDTEGLVLEIAQLLNQVPQGGACGRALSGVCMNGRGVGLGNLEPDTHVLFRRIAVGQCHRSSLGLDGREKLRAAPALQDGGKLPSDVHGVANPSVHAITARRDELVAGISVEPDTSGTEMVGD